MYLISFFLEIQMFINVIQNPALYFIYLSLCHTEALSISVCLSGVKCYNYLFDKLPLSMTLSQYKILLKTYIRESDLEKVLNSPK